MLVELGLAEKRYLEVSVCLPIAEEAISGGKILDPTEMPCIAWVIRCDPHCEGVMGKYLQSRRKDQRKTPLD